MFLNIFNRKRFGEHLLQKNKITQEQLDAALDYQKKHSIRLGKALIELGFLTGDDIAKALSSQLKIPHIKNLYEAGIEKELVDMVNVNVLNKNLFIPMFIQSGSETGAGDWSTEPQEKQGGQDGQGDDLRKFIAVACSDVYNDEIHDTCVAVYGLEPYYCLGKPSDIKRWLEDYMRERRLEKGSGNIRGSIIKKNTYDLNSLKSQSHTVHQANKILLTACRKGALDVHILPEKEKVKVSFRIDGDLRFFTEYTHDLASALIGRLKNMAGCNSIENRRPQDGGFEAIADGRVMDMRLASTPIVFGQEVVIRILDPLTIERMSLDTLGFTTSNKRKFESFLRSPRGIFIVTGPTGSGKSTTLYTGVTTLLKEKNGALAVNTIDDPVEYRISGIAQTEVNEKAGVTPETALKAFVRLDPDILLASEIRDRETAMRAIEAANMGRLVMTTIHANDSLSAIIRLLQLGVPNFHIVNMLLGTTAQILVKRLCRFCAEPYELLIDSERLAKIYSEAPETALKLKKPTGCEKCDNTGFSGRIPLQEVLVMTPGIKQAVSTAITTDNDLQSTRDIALSEGLVPLFFDGMDKVKKGITTYDEVAKGTNINTYSWHEM